MAGVFANGIQLPTKGTSQYFDVPSGTINGVNDTFTLSIAPEPSESLKLVNNGLILKQGDDYTLVGNTITFNALAIPQGGDQIYAFFTI